MFTSTTTDSVATLTKKSGINCVTNKNDKGTMWELSFEDWYI
jgi:hypothetical protein